MKFIWDEVDDSSDEIATTKFNLNQSASTKREVTRTIASIYDPFNINGPLLNRARIFMHKLQCNSELKWDTVLPNHDLKVWKNIAIQVNSSPAITLNRCVGEKSDSYSLVGICR